MRAKIKTIPLFEKIVKSENYHFPVLCESKYAKICDSCEHVEVQQVSHPGGSSVHSVDKNRCEFGFWEEDF